MLRDYPESALEIPFTQRGINFEIFQRKILARFREKSTLMFAFPRAMKNCLLKLLSVRWIKTSERKSKQFFSEKEKKMKIIFLIYFFFWKLSRRPKVKWDESALMPTCNYMWNISETQLWSSSRLWNWVSLFLSRSREILKFTVTTARAVATCAMVNVYVRANYKRALTVDYLKTNVLLAIRSRMTLLAKSNSEHVEGVRKKVLSKEHNFSLSVK